MKRILVIDDEEEICALLSGLLRKQGHYVVAENNLEGGLASFKEQHFDLVFLDLNLPDGLGFDLIPKLKVVDPTVHVCIISAYDGHAEREKANKLGASEFLSKPFSRDVILNVLESIKVVQ